MCRSDDGLLMTEYFISFPPISPTFGELITLGISIGFSIALEEIGLLCGF